MTEGRVLLLDLRNQLVISQAELAQSRLETARLRKELMDTLALLQQPRNIHTQTTPRQQEDEEELVLVRLREELRRQQAELDAVRATLSSERRHFEQEKQQWVEPVRTAATTLATTTTQTAAGVRFRSQSSPSLVEAAAEEAVSDGEQQQHVSCRQEAARLREKIHYLERQLDTTENSLRTNQNLVSENSARTYELNSQLVQIKMTLNETKRLVDEQRLKLDQKEELVRKIVDDKSELFER